MKPQTIDKDTEAEKKKDHLRKKKKLAVMYVSLKCWSNILQLY